MRPRPGRPASRSLSSLLAGLILVVGGCGSDDSSEEDEGPSAEATQCRESWQDLEDEVDGRDSATTPSTLAPRWNSVVATIEYYASAATEDDCGETLEAQETAITALESYSAKLERFDLELELDDVREDAEEYVASPAPSPAPKGKKRKNAPPTPAQVKKALATLTTQAPLATEQQGPGWQQARAVDLADKAAVAKSVKDLAFLSAESAAYRAGKAHALATIRKAEDAG